ncbi:hypothetical protein PHLGIDRAFT_167660 [Phlebiopsis gigantea 11061_1 CR5-6]|uniref:Uncharacterized protein n=1 Tax=Phlebiopsis gigantea (strain 11061_1 CR5-6) TaxID=745531 RepID=A0A0C3S4M3_PHLG1|nr:hypothetical protein PHLGIDRAFT_167660 [Phlebiopsis gigantea 11061_1 CR5-6]
MSGCRTWGRVTSSWRRQPHHRRRTTRGGVLHRVLMRARTLALQRPRPTLGRRRVALRRLPPLLWVWSCAPPFQFGSPTHRDPIRQIWRPPPQR